MIKKFLFQNGGGDGISPATICTIVDVVRGHGFKVKTEKCPCCGQYAYITGVSREDLELIEDISEELIHEENYTTLWAGSDLYYIDEEEETIEHCKIHDIVYKDGKVNVFSVYFDDGSFDEFYGCALGDNFFINRIKAIERLAVMNKTPI